MTFFNESHYHHYHIRLIGLQLLDKTQACAQYRPTVLVKCSLVYVH